MTTAGPLAYGLLHWQGALVLERESQQAGRLALVALGHGLRWTEDCWIEVAVHQPGSKLALSHPAILVTAVDHRLDLEAGERRARGLPGGAPLHWRLEEQPVEVRVDGRPLPLAVRGGGDLRSGAVRFAGAVLMITSYRCPDWDGLPLSRVSDLTPYLLGAVADVKRRQALPPRWADPPPRE